MKNHGSKTLLSKVNINLNQEEFAFHDFTPTVMIVTVNGTVVPLELTSDEYFKVQGDLNDENGTGSYKTADAKSFDLMTVVSDKLRNDYDYYSSDIAGYEFVITNCDDTVIALSPRSGDFFGWNALSEAQNALDLIEKLDKKGE